MKSALLKTALGIVATAAFVLGPVGMASAGGPPPPAMHRHPHPAHHCMHCKTVTKTTWKKVVTVKWVKVKHVIKYCHHA